MYFAVQWFVNTSELDMFGMLAVIVIAQMILGVLDKLTGFGKKSDGTTFNVFTTENFINSMMSVAFGMVLYVIIDLLLSENFVGSNENPILCFALSFLIVMGVYLELKRRGKLDFN